MERRRSPSARLVSLPESSELGRMYPPIEDGEHAGNVISPECHFVQPETGEDHGSANARAFRRNQFKAAVPEDAPLEPPFFQQNRQVFSNSRPFIERQLRAQVIR